MVIDRRRVDATIKAIACEDPRPIDCTVRDVPLGILVGDFSDADLQKMIFTVPKTEDTYPSQETWCQLIEGSTGVLTKLGP